MVEQPNGNVIRSEYAIRLITDYSGPVGQERIRKIAESKRQQPEGAKPAPRQHNYSEDPVWVDLSSLELGKQSS